VTLLLPDVSEFQPHTDMRGVKAANGGAAIIRACYGTSHPDAVFSKLRAAASGFSFLGIYHYITAAQDAATQAHAFVRLVGHLAPHEVPILDLEEGTGNQSARAAAWLGVADEAFGLTPLPLPKRSWVYSGEAFAQEHGLGPLFASPRHTWVAAYRGTEPTLGHTLWQSTNGLVGSHVTSWPGAGHCDTNLFRGTLAQLSDLIRRC
jgi:GH25 family lysozyme M1 (1,4-beta-N-acetylmuramidase)